MKPPGQHGDPYVSGSLLLFHAVWQKEAGHGTGWAITSHGEGNNCRAEEATSSRAVQEHPLPSMSKVSTLRCKTLSCLNLLWRNIQEVELLSVPFLQKDGLFKNSLDEGDLDHLLSGYYILACLKCTSKCFSQSWCCQIRNSKREKRKQFFEHAAEPKK